MKFISQDWKEANLKPLLERETDVLVINRVPCEQLTIHEFLTRELHPAPQDPMDQMWVSIISDTRGEQVDNLKGNTKLEWHIDKGYCVDPFDFVALYSVDVSENVPRTLFTSSRILDELPEGYADRNRDAKVWFDVDRAIYDPQYGYAFRKDSERRWFRRRYPLHYHDLIQRDAAGEYVYYCEPYAVDGVEAQDQIHELMYSDERLYKHSWKRRQLIVYNNKTTNHSREAPKEGGCKRHLWKIGLYEDSTYRKRSSTSNSHTETTT